MLSLEIISVEKKIYEGSVQGIQLPGTDGSFEIFSSHAPLVSALKKGKIVVIKDSQTRTEIDIPNTGFVEVSNNKVSVILG